MGIGEWKWVRLGLKSICNTKAQWSLIYVLRQSQHRGAWRRAWKVGKKPFCTYIFGVKASQATMDLAISGLNNRIRRQAA